MSITGQLCGGVTAALMLVTGCVLCSSTITVVASPSRRMTAHVLENDCGATVDWARQVTLTHGSEEPIRGWNEGVIEQGTVLRIGGQPQIEVHWTSDTSVTIRFRKEHVEDPVFKAATSWEGVLVTLEEIH